MIFWAVVQNKFHDVSKGEQQSGNIPYRKMDLVQLVVSFVASLRSHKDAFSDLVTFLTGAKQCLRSKVKLGVDALRKPDERASAAEDSRVEKHFPPENLRPTQTSFTKLLEAHKLILLRFDTSCDIISSD